MSTPLAAAAWMSSIIFRSPTRLSRSASLRASSQADASFPASCRHSRNLRITLIPPALLLCDLLLCPVAQQFPGAFERRCDAVAVGLGDLSGVGVQSLELALEVRSARRRPLEETAGRGLPILLVACCFALRIGLLGAFFASLNIFL